MYVAKLVLVVVLTAVLMAFVLAPVVDALANFRIPRSLGAFLAVALLVTTVATVSYLSYARALDFLSQMPEYRTKLQHIVNEIKQQAERFDKTTDAVCHRSPKTSTPLRCGNATASAAYIGRNMSTVSETLLASLVRSVPDLLHVELAGPRAGVIGDAVPDEEPQYSVRDARAYRPDDSFIHRWKLHDRPVPKRGEHGCLWFDGASVFLFPRRDQRFPEPDSLSRR